ncbi:MAG: hypothetical protein UZ07_CHB004003022 [Chlorobi bacterium OLB7]|nr:MAG: hypothetical protein UZ07_CHB004003022 [Chlorobi bacterium OLB7]
MGCAGVVPVACRVLLVSRRRAPCQFEDGHHPHGGGRKRFGRATVRDEMTRELIRKFREDNSLRVVDAAQADSRLEVTITNIRNDERRNISTGEIETVRGVTISAQVTFLDNLKRTSVFANRAFSGDAQYRLDEGAAGEERAIRTAVDKITSEILLAAVADW